ncbi:hypothetical protein QUB10_32920 [Microcoleus sp. B5-D4]|uniref:hypothetical protein n=1 Tax=unclassified Microcoleus TaxID=2642155 RepID=UPI002FD56EA7
MYTLEQLEQKNLKELKEIGWQLNVLPDGDRRCRQNWIDALVGVQPPLLQLLEDSPVAEVEPVQEAIEVQDQEPLLESSPEAVECPSCGAAHALYTTKDCLDKPLIRCLHCDYSRFKNYPGAIQLEVQEPPIESKFGRIVYRIVYPKPAVKPIAQNAETRSQLDRTESADVHNRRSHPAESVRDSSGAKAEALGSKEGDRVLALAGNSKAVRGGVLPHQSIELAVTFNDEQPPNRGEGKGRIEPKVSQSAIAPAANSPGFKSKSTAHQLLELFKSSAHIIPDSPANEKVTETVIGQTESAQNPTPTGCTLSAEFLARYSPPQTQIFHFQSELDGQLNLLDFEVESTDEPPDPDDFESLDAFQRAIALWDAQHPELIEIGLDSFCEWAPCPDEWYEPEPSEVMELSGAGESSITCEFLIPVFDAWCDRAARQTDTDEPPNPEDYDSMFAFWAAYDAWVSKDDDTDEPPDTGIFARLPKPKPPSFPPMIVGKGDRANSIRKFARGATLAIGRAPPGGDAMQ